MQSRARHPHPLTEQMTAYRPELLLGAVRLVGHLDAEDLLQSTFERALQRLDSFQPETNLVAWLRRIMTNLSVDFWRRRSRYATCPINVDQDCPAPEPAQTALWKQFTTRDLHTAAAALPPQFREVFALHHDEGLAYAAIAARLHLPVATVGTRLLRARRFLRAWLVDALENGAIELAMGAPFGDSPPAGPSPGAASANDTIVAFAWPVAATGTSPRRPHQVAPASAVPAAAAG